MTLEALIDERRAAVAVIGLGHAGLPLAVAIAKAGFPVVGVESDLEKVELLTDGESYLVDVSGDEVAALITSGRLQLSAKPEALATTDVIIVCVPTPLRDELPDMSFIESAGKDIAATLQPGKLVILSSTTYPGTTEEFLRNILEMSGLRAGEDFYLGYSPERINPGSVRSGIEEIPKIIGGIDAKSTALIETLYKTFVKDVVTVSSPRAAEMVKLLENTYRHVNIALANELAILCHEIGIDVWEVIDAAATKPFGFHPFYPGPGWGGHCIPVDPAYLSWRVRQMGETARFIELALDINRFMPTYVVQRVSECLKQAQKGLRGSSIFILGVTYKPDVSDFRESPALEIIELLRSAGAAVHFNDPYVDRIPVGGDFLESSAFEDRKLEEADLVLVTTHHSSYDWERVAARSRRILDTRNALRGFAGPIVTL